MRPRAVMPILLVLAILPAPRATRAADDPLSDPAIEDRIQRHRTAEVTLTVTDEAGRPLANVPVTVRMTAHRFLFGCNIFPMVRGLGGPLNALYRKRFADLLNFATLPFYWNSYERQEGQTIEPYCLQTAKWCAENGIRTKGHPLVWTHEPPWLKDKDPAEAERLLYARIEREIKAFAGVTDAWDVINEVVVGPEQAKHRDARTILRLYERDGREKIVKRVFAFARRAGPRATLVLNDYDTSDKYEKLIESSLKAGVPIDAIGIQSHMHGGYWGAKRTWSVCERFARFGRPLHFTELTILSGETKGYQGDRRVRGWDSTPEGEKRQGEQVREFYRLLYSHPAVEAVTWWDFSDLNAWQGAPAGLLRKDMTPKPAYDALMGLVKKDWWTDPAELKTDGAGRVRFRGFLGTYEAVSGGRKGTFSVDKAGIAAKRAALVAPR